MGGQVCQCGTPWWGQWQRVAEDSGPPHVTWTPACPSAGRAWARGALAAAFRLCLGLGLGARGALSAAACGQSVLWTARGRESPQALRVSLGSSQVCCEGGQHGVPRPGAAGAAAGIQAAQARPGKRAPSSPFPQPLFLSARCPLPLASPSEGGLLARSCTPCVWPAGPPASLAAALCPSGDQSLTPLRRPSPSAAHAACTSVLVHVALLTRGCYGRILRSRDAARERTCVLNLEGNCQIAFVGSQVSAPAKSPCACCSVLGGVSPPGSAGLGAGALLPSSRAGVAVGAPATSHGWPVS